MTKSYFFYGVYEGNEGDETWKVLHDHFEKLARQDDDAGSQVIFTDRKASSKEEVRE